MKVIVNYKRTAASILTIIDQSIPADFFLFWTRTRTDLLGHASRSVRKTTVLWTEPHEMLNCLDNMTLRSSRCSQGHWDVLHTNPYTYATHISPLISVSATYSRLSSVQVGQAQAVGLRLRVLCSFSACWRHTASQLTKQNGESVTCWSFRIRRKDIPIRTVAMEQVRS